MLWAYWDTLRRPWGTSKGCSVVGWRLVGGPDFEPRFPVLWQEVGAVSADWC